MYVHEQMFQMTLLLFKENTCAKLFCNPCIYVGVMAQFAPLSSSMTSAVQMDGSIGEWFRTTVGVRQVCLLSPSLFNIFIERIMSDALEEHDGKVSIGGGNITNLQFADDIDALAEEEQELEALVESLDKTCTRYKIEISAEKTKLMTNSANGIQREIKVKGQKLGTVGWLYCCFTSTVNI